MGLFALYLAIIVPLGSTAAPATVCCSALGYLLTSTGFTLTSINFALESSDLYSSLQAVRAALEEVGGGVEVAKLKDRLDRLGPLSGLGLFSVERSTLTSMVSTAVTYLIILIQFKTSL